MNIVGSQKVAEWEALPSQDKYQTMLSDHFWGEDHCGEVDELVKQHLLHCWMARSAGIELEQTVRNDAGPNGQEAMG